MSINRIKAKNLGNEKYALGESPFYDSRYDRFSWVDIIDNKFWSMNKDGERTSFDLGQPIGAAVPTFDSDAMILAAKDGLYRYEGGNTELIYGLNDTFKPYVRCNDAKADPVGRLWFGSSVADDEHEAEGDLYRFDGDSVAVMQPGTKIANGMAWDSECKYMYFADSVDHAIYRYDYDKDSGDISNREVLFNINDGAPDGMCIDSDDNLWVAVWGGNRIEKHSGKNGELLGIVEVPAHNVTSCCFAGAGSNMLYITTSGNDLNGEYDGCLFTCEVDSEGLDPDYVTRLKM